MWKVYFWFVIMKEVLWNVIMSINEIGSWIVCCNVIWILFSDFGMIIISDVIKLINLV